MMEKPVSEMTPEEYLEYLNSLPKQSFMDVVAHDVKKVVSIAHGYISLLRLDIEEDLLNAEQVQEYMQEMESMFEKSYIYIEQAEDAYKSASPDDEMMKHVAHNVKKSVSIAHGYISLLRLDIEENLLNAKRVKEYIDEMESMFEKSYAYIEDAENNYRGRYSA